MFVGSVLQVARSQGFPHTLHNSHLLPVHTPSLPYPIQRNTRSSLHKRRFTNLAEVGTFIQANSHLVSVATTVTATSGVLWLSGWRASKFLNRYTEEIVKPMFAKMQSELSSVIKTEISGVRQEISDAKVEFSKEISNVRQEISDVKVEFSKEISNVRQEISGVRQEISDVRVEFSKEISSVKEEISDVKKEVSLLTLGMGNLTKVTDRLEVQVNELIKETNGLKRESTLQSGEIARLRDKIEGPGSVVTLINGFKEGFEVRLSKQEREIAKLIRESVKPTDRDPLDESTTKVSQKVYEGTL